MFNSKLLQNRLHAKQTSVATVVFCIVAAFFCYALEFLSTVGFVLSLFEIESIYSKLLPGASASHYIATALVCALLLKGFQRYFDSVLSD